MDPEQPIDALHCGPWGGRNYGGGGGGRPKEPIQTDVEAVHGRTLIFSVPHACLAAGLLKARKGLSADWQAVLELAFTQWQGDPQLFLSDAARMGITCESVNCRAASLSGAIIGWQSKRLDKGNKSQGVAHGICADLEMTLAIVSRRVGDIFIAKRDPDYGWNALFGSPFECDEDLGPAPSKDCEPWDRFQW